MVIDDLVVLLAAGIGTLTFGTNFFATTKATIPPGAGPFLWVGETGGSGPEGTHNQVFAGLPAYQRPTAQIVATALDPVAARSLIDAAYAAVVKVGMTSQLVNSVWWRDVVPLQEPNEALGLDDDARQRYSFNIAITKRPNAAMSA